MVPVPNHPYATYRAGPNAVGQWWIQCACRHCGDTWSKRCFYPDRTNQWVMRYAQQHAHGLRPMVRR